MYGKRLNSGGTDSQIFIAENLNISVRAYERAFISLDKNIVGKKLEFLRWAEIKKLHISGRDGSVKVGVKQNCIEKNRYLLCSRLDQRVYLNMWSKKKPSNSNFVKRRAQQFVPVLIFGVDKKLAFERWSDFRLEKNYFAILTNTKVVSITFRLT